MTSPLLRQVFVAAAICLNTLGHGAGLGYSAVLVPQLQDESSPIPVTANMASWIAAVTAPSLIVGNSLSASIMSKLGRKITTYIMSGGAIVGWAALLLAPNFEFIIIGRILQGVSFGMAMPLRSIVLGEYTSPKYRGTFLTTISLGQTFGILFAHFTGTLFHWQITGLIITGFFFISHIMTIYSPESPSFLATKGRFEECRQAFHWLRGYEEEAELDDLIETCLLLEKDRIEESTLHKRSFRDRFQMITKPEFYKPIVVMAHCYNLGQVSGSTILANYPLLLLGSVLVPGSNVKFWMIALDTQRLLTNIGAVFIISKVKRRTMVISVASLSAFSMFCISAYVYLRHNSMLPYDAAWIPILLLNIQVFCIGMGMVPLPAIIAGEIFPLEYRSIGSSFSLISNALLMFVALKTFPLLVEYLGMHGSYLLYGCFTFYNVCVIYFLMPETRGKTLQQIEDEFRGRPLKAHEIRERQSLQNDELYQRKMSLRKASVHSIAL
ncbi:hypothetical protein JYU34_019755 [Plutella xylostella]|uniref:Major facilitator superfamily (MFS) profile domain-containing protein n=1 Tax=Plutella xylostella TaxID=51655 RepID=A0ABQ7PV86_PLUXY|nr:hypothetical protein JYU34_019755 [Plutella xylostella]